MIHHRQQLTHVRMRAEHFHHQQCRDAFMASRRFCFYLQRIFIRNFIHLSGAGVEVFRRTVQGDDFGERKIHKYLRKFTLSILNCINHSLATCNPSCRNGGSCIFRDMCQCTKDFVGPQCQYSVDRCAAQKLGFNGAIRCSGSSLEMRCTLSCPPGVQFDSPPAAAYTCKYETATFVPARVPRCVYGEREAHFYYRFRYRSHSFTI